MSAAQFVNAADRDLFRLEPLEVYQQLDLTPLQCLITPKHHVYKLTTHELLWKFHEFSLVFQSMMRSTNAYTMTYNLEVPSDCLELAYISKKLDENDMSHTEVPMDYGRTIIQCIQAPMDQPLLDTSYLQYVYTFRQIYYEMYRLSAGYEIKHHVRFRSQPFIESLVKESFMTSCTDIDGSINIMLD